MLSSGTLNLKFMQRKTNTKPAQEEPRQRKDTKQISAITSKEQSSSSTLHHHSPTNTPTLRIIFEESLISFPWLSCHRPAHLPSDSANTLPAHIGRKSYGEFNKAIQKLEEGGATIEEEEQIPNHKRAQSESSITQETRPEKKKRPTNNNNNTRVPDLSTRRSGTYREVEGVENLKIDEKMAHGNEDQKRVSKKKKQSDHQEQTEGESGFKKPYTSTTIKTKRKQQPNSSNLNHTQSNQTQTTNESTSLSIQNKKKTNKIRKEDQGRSNSGVEDEDAVNLQIEEMFQQARNATQSS
ncbi:hypothetical protein MJO28_008651 [Puccinia striiformis f. sp. tritici]|uniref:Uncharacterized protein n=2 Tax=Puccinia striiformis TaxID=27350 RepID=A0A2S4V3U4_9BASI|nr:hypothetical protein Pst134EA_015295 [Puccinia striiformis f. sp. tritici]KAH9463212.1 hypothetical protein Pst134EA_015295 [Puccinia striiformis f. sp. tritici]KAI7949830.1 hypothetical protein MJO28_008651 [Puccinia striiformis f. sp. tritici]KAI7952901.1 hypothetical protein MJO29_008532 [Puccinia striiformis f. sp. tritici]POW04167.1 hypothetical protein PSTT_10608 [Puccinia striiformis]